MAASTTSSSSSPPVAPLDLSKTAVQFPAWCETRGYGCKRLLSRSHFSTVWLVQAKNGELRVLKEMHVAAASDAERLPREAELLLAQRHPFILRAHALLRDDAAAASLALVTEFCDRGDLHSVLSELRRRGEPALAEPTALSWLGQLGLALRHLHGQRVLHRDVKSSNVFVCGDGTVRLGDFGLASALRAADDALLSRVGSPFYMSPEICRSQPYGPEADIWSLGCVLYECVCLCHAFYAETIAGVLARICAADYAPPPPGACSPALRELLAAMLHLEPAMRPSAEEALRHPALRSVLAQLEPPPPPPDELGRRLPADGDGADRMRAAAAAAAPPPREGWPGGDGGGGGDGAGSGAGARAGARGGRAASPLRPRALLERGLARVRGGRATSPARSRAAAAPPPPARAAAEARPPAAGGAAEAAALLGGLREALAARLGAPALEAALREARGDGGEEAALKRVRAALGDAAADAEAVVALAAWLG